MNKVKLFLVVLALAFLSGCASMFGAAPIPASTKLSPAAQSVQTTLNEANIAITAAANVIAQDVTDKIMLKTDAEQYIVTLKSYAKQVDAAQALLDAGDIANAKTQAELASRLILELHKRVAAQARKGTTEFMPPLMNPQNMWARFELHPNVA